MKIKQSRSDITSRYQPVARLDLSYVSENKGFGISPNTHFGGWGGATAAATTTAATATKMTTATTNKTPTPA